MDELKLAEAVRNACARAAEEAFEDAGVQGLCVEGRWEAALGAIRALDLRPLLAPPGDDAPPPAR